MMRTFQTRFCASAEDDALLQEYATRTSRVEHRLLSKVLAAKGVFSTLNDLKRETLVASGLTARQYNASLVATKGLIQSAKELQKQHAVDLAAKIEILQIPPEERKKKGQKPRKCEPETPFQKHGRLRRLHRTETKLAKLKADLEAGKVHIAYGSKKLFAKQHQLSENGYENHAAWKQDWVNHRENQFSVLGSKDETGGCVGCVATCDDNGMIQLRVRLPNGMATKHIVLRDLTFNVGHYALRMAILKNGTKSEKDGLALSYRFVKDGKSWRIFVSFDLPDVEIISRRDLGRIGIDLNADHLAVSEIDRFGNVVARSVIPLITQGLSTNQVMACVGDAIKPIVAQAAATRKPIAVEKLDFTKKKATLLGEGVRYSRMLSGLAYAAILQNLKSRAFDAGIEVLEVNPAYTSVIGGVLFQHRYGMSRHQGAAVAIGRRSMEFRERLPLSLRGTPLRPEDRSRHVWSLWAKVAKRIAAPTAPSVPRKSSSAAPSCKRVARGEKFGPQGAKQAASVGRNPRRRIVPCSTVGGCVIMADRMIFYSL
jgi:IS605 OrfB family transposase